MVHDLLNTCSKHTTFKLQQTRILTRHTKHNGLIFLICVATMHHLKYSGQKSKKQFAVCDSDIPVTLKQGQGLQPW